MNATATARVVEQRATPITSTQPTPQLKITGQELYNSFVQADDSDKSRLNKLRKLVSDGVEVSQLAGSLEKMVEIARADDMSHWQGPTNEKGRAVDADGKVVRGNKEQQAMNVRTIIQSAYGALRFAPEECKKEGYDDNTGYLAMRVIAKKALDDKGITWKGEPQKTDADKEAKRVQKAQAEEMAFIMDRMSKTPNATPNETLRDKMARVEEAAREELATIRAKAASNAVKALAESLLKKHGEDMLIQVVSLLIQQKSEEVLSALPEDVALAFAESVCGLYGVEITNPSEPDEEANAQAMAEVPEEQAAH